MVTRHGITFDRTHSAADHGIDSGDSISEAIDQDGLLTLDPGTYTVDQFVKRAGGAWGIVGMGDTPEDVVIKPRPGYSDRSWMIWKNRASLLENLTLHHGEAEDTAFGAWMCPNEKLIVRNVQMIGPEPPDSRVRDRNNAAFGVGVWNSDGQLLFDNVTIQPTVELADYPGNRIPVMHGYWHTGVATYRNLCLANGGNGIYANNCPGVTRIEGGAYENNQVASLRLGGGGFYVKGAEIVIDPSLSSNTGSWEHNAMRGIWWRGDADDPGKRGSGGVIEGCDIWIRNQPKHGDAIRVDEQLGGMTIQNTRIRSDSEDAPHLTIRNPMSGASRPHTVHLEDVHFSGKRSAPAVSAQRKTTVAGVNVDLPGCSVPFTGNMMVSKRTDGQADNPRVGRYARSTSASVPDDGVVLRITPQDDPVNYAFSASDGVWFGGFTGYGADSIGHDKRVSGAVWPGNYDEYLLAEPAAANWTFSNPADLTLDGEVVEPDQLDWRPFSIRSMGDRAAYTFEVSGRVRPVDVNDNDAMVDASKTVATGFVNGGRDAWEISGEVVAFHSLPAAARVVTKLDGEEVAFKK